MTVNEFQEMTRNIINLDTEIVIQVNGIYFEVKEVKYNEFDKRIVLKAL